MRPFSIAIALLAVSAAAPAADPDPHDRVVQALTDGNRAVARRDAKMLDRSQRLLVTLGAQPREGTPDLTRHWRAEADRLARRPFPDVAPLRGRVLGSGYQAATLPKGGSLTLEQIFLGGQKAKVSVVPNSPAELALSVSEGEAAPLCARRAAQTPASCAWLPIWTTRYRIRIVNRGTKPAPVYIVVN